MTILDCINSQKQYRHALKKKCADVGCMLDLNHLPPYVVLKGEDLFPDCPICDCIIFLDNESESIAGVVELKSKTVDVSRVRQQLENGLLFISGLTKKCGLDIHSVRIIALVLAKQWRKSELAVIKKGRLEIQGKKFFIRTKRCGTKFSEIIN